MNVLPNNNVNSSIVVVAFEFADVFDPIDVVAVVAVDDDDDDVFANACKFVEDGCVANAVVDD